MEPTTRQFKQHGREWFVVEGEAGAITFFTQPARGGGLMAGDLGYHDAADEPKWDLTEDGDPYWTTGCTFVQTPGCRYSGYQAPRLLDALSEGGAADVFSILTTVYHSHFSGK